jgi:hypothetical protein
MYQEYKPQVETRIYWVQNKRIQKIEEVKYYGFVGIVNHDKHRIKIVIREYANGRLEFVSVIPHWKVV